jgi:ATP-dependent DNA helicase RecG
MPDRAAELSAWDSPVASARFVDRARVEALARLDIHSVGDLVHHYPFRYLDLTDVETLRDVRPGTEATVVGRVHDIKERRPRPRLTITEVGLVDGTGALIGVWFNQSWMAQRFVRGERVAFAGKVELDYGLKKMKNPFVERLGSDDDASRVGRVLPIHRTTEGLTTNWLRRLVSACVDDFADVPDHLPVSIRAHRRLLPLRAAIRAVHFPASMAEAEIAHRRLAYDELFLLQCYMAMRKHAVTREHAGIRHCVNGSALEKLRNAIPFTLTEDQRRSTEDVLADMASPRPMNRMLLGDVGTGKTLVAAHALAAAADSSSQAAMMAPTEVLATQYAEKVGPLLAQSGVTWALLVGSTPAAERRRILEQTASGEMQVLFGTHALLEQSVSFAKLTLAIVDEQHRFGVSQRLGLRGKGASADLLVMTATPIPRSLALTLYGDLDTSYLRERPHGFGLEHVTTKLVKSTRRDDAYKQVRRAVRDGRQAYVVCALVDESDVASARAATREAERLRTQVFSDLKVGLLTGRMKSAEKTAVMRDFRDGKVNVLVSTTVIEVGVDVPNATVMIVEDAERFGLAQLHQLRGRIGRGEHPGTFLLFADPKTTEGRERMAAIEATNDGFELAEYDLRLRGEGHILGDRQHGLPALRLASVLTDAPLIEQARKDAAQLIESDPHLSRPEHQPLLREVKRTFAAAWEWVSSG